jgi:hypothetical protein
MALFQFAKATQPAFGRRRIPFPSHGSDLTLLSQPPSPSNTPLWVNTILCTEFVALACFDHNSSLIVSWSHSTNTLPYQRWFHQGMPSSRASFAHPCLQRLRISNRPQRSLLSTQQAKHRLYHDITLYRRCYAASAMAVLKPGNAFNATTSFAPNAGLRRDPIVYVEKSLLSAPFLLYPISFCLR